MQLSARLGLFFCALLASMSIVASPGPTRQDVDLYLLLSTEPSSVRLSLRGLMLERSVDTRVLDVVAQRLIETRHPAAGDAVALEALTLSAQLLGRSRNARYEAALRVAAQKYAEPSLQAAIKAARAQLGAVPADSYRPGSLTLVGEKSRIAVRQKDFVLRSDRSQKLPLSGMASLQQVLDALGAPDHIGEALLPPEQNLGMSGSFRAGLTATGAGSLELLYFGRGSIVFQYGAGWTPVHARPEIRHPVIRYAGDHLPEAYRLMSSDHYVMGRQARELYAQRRRLEPDLADVVADRLWLGMFSRDAQEQQGLTVLCWVLGKTADARYRQVLSDLAGAAVDKRLAHQAQKALRKLPPASASAPVYQRRLVPAI